MYDWYGLQTASVPSVPHREQHTLDSDNENKLNLRTFCYFCGSAPNWFFRPNIFLNFVDPHKVFDEFYVDYKSRKLDSNIDDVKKFSTVHMAL